MKDSLSRRSFIKTTGTAAAMSGLLANPFHIFAQGSPNRKVVVAVMGIRSRGKALAKAFAAVKDCEIAYLCDVDDRYFDDCLAEIAKFQKKVPKKEKDLRKVLEDKQLDALVVAAPDHWHAPAALMALKAGKHVYLEKPCGHNPREGEILVEAQKKYNRVVQMGNQRRSWSRVNQCMQEIQEGIIGNVYFAKGWYANGRGSIGYGKEAPVPDFLDYELFQGPAPRTPYRDNIHPYNWHWFKRWGTGESCNNGTHEIDAMRWGMGLDYPTRIVASGGRYHYKDDWEFPDTMVVTYDFEDGKTFTWESRSCNKLPIEGGGRGVIFYGEKGTIVMPGGNSYKVYNNDRDVQLIKEVKDDTKPAAGADTDKTNTIGPGMRLDVVHVENFVQSIQNGTPNSSPIDEGHKSILMCHLANIAYESGRALNIDQRNGHIIGDRDAMQSWSREYEPGWEMVV
ncbi:MAG: Gfo/Idh/MocA family oxidoreductase [Bacteroidota bacterium]